MPRPAGRPMKTFRGDEVGEKKELEAGFEPWSSEWENRLLPLRQHLYLLNAGYRTYKTLIETVS